MYAPVLEAVQVTSEWPPSRAGGTEMLTWGPMLWRQQQGETKQEETVPGTVHSVTDRGWDKDRGCSAVATMPSLWPRQTGGRHCRPASLHLLLFQAALVRLAKEKE